jgi:serine kinase of HPr protein (carbohydrate metabolism regulator)
VAVASLKDLACIIIANSNKPAQDLLDAAEEEGIPVITTSLPAFEFAGKLYKALKA